MSSWMRVLALSCGWWIAVLHGCGGEDRPPGGGIVTGDTDAGDRIPRCVDEDDDGFGQSCMRGLDCDDGDPEVTDECRRCVQPNDNCPCEPGTEPSRCDPDDIRTTQNGVTGVLVCSEGMRYCRDAVWSECEILWQYATFMPDP